MQPQLFDKMTKEDTVWKTAAALQSLFWFFAVPPLLKPHWEGFWSEYSPLQAQVLLNEMGLAYFAIAALLMVPIYSGNYAFFERYKISDQEWHWRSEKAKVSFGHSATYRPCVSHHTRPYLHSNPSYTVPDFIPVRSLLRCF